MQAVSDEAGIAAGYDRDSGLVERGNNGSAFGHPCSEPLIFPGRGAQRLIFPSERVRRFQNSWLEGRNLDVFRVSRHFSPGGGWINHGVMLLEKLNGLLDALGVEIDAGIALIVFVVA